MREIDEVGYELCKYQSSLFENSVDILDCSSEYFFKQFMNSKLVKRMDDVGFLFEARDIRNVLDELATEKDLTKGSKKASKAHMAWVGYLLRFWSYTYEIDSKRIYKYIKLNELLKLYEPYHSLDVEEAINRINEAKDIKYINSIESQTEMVKHLIKL